MWELLDMYDKGDRRAGYLFEEYAYAFKGKNQLVWSRGLRDLLGVDEVSDEDIQQPESEVVARIPIVVWQKICHRYMRDVVLELAKNNEIDRIEALIRAYS